MKKILLSLILVLFTVTGYCLEPGEYTIGPGKDYSTISAFEAATDDAPLTGWCTGYIDANYRDNTSVTFDAVTFSSAGITIDVKPEYRTNGVMDVIKSSYVSTVDIATGNVHLRHLQMLRLNPEANSAAISIIVSTTTGTGIEIAYCIIAASAPTGTYCRGIRIRGGHDNYIHNNIIFGWKYSNAFGINGDLNTTGITSFIYNNTFDGNSFAISDSAYDAVMTLKNNIVQGSGIYGYSSYGGWGTGSDYNIGDEGGTVPGGNSTTGVVAFVDTGIRDYRLAESDTLALDTGLTLSNIPALDIAGTARPQGSLWDRGAFERVAPVIATDQFEFFGNIYEENW